MFLAVVCSKKQTIILINQVFSRFYWTSAKREEISVHLSSLRLCILTTYYVYHYIPVRGIINCVEGKPSGLWLCDNDRDLQFPDIGHQTPPPPPGDRPEADFEYIPCQQAMWRRQPGPLPRPPLTSVTTATTLKGCLSRPFPLLWQPPRLPPPHSNPAGRTDAKLKLLWAEGGPPPLPPHPRGGGGSGSPNLGYIHTRHSQPLLNPPEWPLNM